MWLDKVKRGFQRFCDGTSCHGYVELYHAKTNLWLAFWIVTCGVALGLTIYQVQGAIVEYVNSSTDTVILPAKEIEIMYPPMYMCFHHWLNWVDFEKIFDRKYEKSAVLYGLNYFTPIFSETEYNVDESQENFLKLMDKNGYKTMLQFYNSIARTPPIINYTNLTDYFDGSTILFENPVFYYCYVITSENVKKYFQQHPNLDDMEPGRKMLTFSVINENYNYHFNNMSLLVSADEYIEYMKFWISDNTDYEIHDGMYKNLTQFAPPLRLLPNGFDDNDVSILPEIDDYNINFRASACEWMSKPDQLCVSGKQSVDSNETCEFNCLAHTQKNNCRCLDLHFATYLQEDYPKETCRDEFYTITSAGDRKQAPYATSVNTQLNQGCKTNALKTAGYQACLETCVIPCEIWNWEFSVLLTPVSSFAQKISSKHVTDIYIEYPMSSNILTMREENGQSWETFVGNVGGLLGIWTGASIVSLIQLFYLCCCADLDHVPNWMHANRHKITLPQQTITVQAKTDVDAKQVLKRKKVVQSNNDSISSIQDKM